MKRVLILGGAGAIGRRAAAGAIACSAVHEVVISDLYLEKAEAEAAAGHGKARALQLDVFNEEALRAAIRDCDAVLNCAGPFWRTSLPCLKAAIAEGRTYLDVCDGWDTTQLTLQLDEEARKAGVSAVIGLGASPGITNLLARIAAEELDQCDEIVTGVNIDPELREEYNGAPGRAVHWLRQVGGEVTAWREGRPLNVPALQKMRLVLPGIGARLLHMIGHPEALTLPHTIPGLKSASHVLALDLKEAALAEALSDRLSKGQISATEARAMVDHPSKRPLNLRLKLMAAGLGQRRTQTPQLFAYAAGQKHGRHRHVLVSITRLPPGGAAGAAAAALIVGLDMALGHRLGRSGVSAPEDIVDPHVFFEEYAKPATPKGVAPSALIHIEAEDRTA